MLAIEAGGCIRLLTPRQARAANVAYTVLSSSEVRTLEAFGEVLLPGAIEDGLSHYVDHHLAVAAADSLLMIRYLDIPPPYLPFYRLGVANLDKISKAQHGVVFADASDQQKHDIVDLIRNSNPESWAGPPAPLFYYVIRADAVDVVYGTVEGFSKLDLPYMAHIVPPTRW